MADETLVNQRIDQLPLGTPQPTDWLIFRDMTAGITKRFSAADVLTSAIANDIEWVSDNDPGYALNEIVTYGGKIWQSKIADNLNIVPGTDATKWELLTKGAVWARWAAGAFLEDDVFVIREIDGEDHIVQLVDVARPYNSTDFDAEYLAGDWVSLTQNVIVKAGTLAAGTVQLDLMKLKDRVFDVGNITEAKAWSLLNSDKMIKFRAVFQISGGLSVQTFPVAWQISTIAGMYDSGANTWTPFDEGFYELEATFIGAILYVKLTQL
jgi:hypothetical protein